MSTRLLYHFTPAHLIHKIKRDGLWRGRLPWNLDREGNPTFRRGFQWLTTNPNFQQPWCLLGELPFPKNAHRITVLIPEPKMRQLFRWLELCRRCSPDSAEELNRTGGDVENWCVFHGRIPPAWFLEIERNAGELFLGTNAPRLE